MEHSHENGRPALQADPHFAPSGDTTHEKIIRQAFAAHPLDVVATVNTASEVFYWLEELLHAIQIEVQSNLHGCVSGNRANPASLLRIKKLAGMGAYLASEHGNYMDCQQEDYKTALRNAGIGEQEVGHD